MPASFHGTAIRGDGTDEDVLRRAGAQGADVFLAVTEGDNRNIMAAQLANEALGIERVIAKINDPLRSTAYAELGIATLCRTGLMLDAINDYLGLPVSGMPGMLEPTGPHGGPEHDPIGPSSDAAPDLITSPATIAGAGAAASPGGPATRPTATQEV